MNEIFSYATYWILKNKENSVECFRSTVLNNGIENYRDLIRIFLKKYNVNCFSLYIKNVVKTFMIEDFITEDTNYFEEECNESDQDKDEII